MDQVAQTCMKCGIKVNAASAAYEIGWVLIS